MLTAQLPIDKISKTAKYYVCEAAKLLGCSRKTIYRACEDNRLRFHHKTVYGRDGSMTIKRYMYGIDIINFWERFR